MLAYTKDYKVKSEKVTALYGTVRDTFEYIVMFIKNLLQSAQSV